MTKLIVEETITSSIRTGVGKHTQMLNSLLDDLNINYEIVSNKFIENIRNSILKRIIFFIWLNTAFFIKLLFEKKDTIVLYTSFLPLLKLKKIKQIGIIHDILYKIYPDKASIISRINSILVNTLIKKNADKILVVSQTVKEEINNILNIPKDKMTVVYNSFSLSLNQQNNTDYILKKYGLNDKKFILSVSSLNPNKNLPMLIKSFDLLNKTYPDMQLVLTGGKQAQIEELKKLSNNINIIFTGYIENNDLEALYHHCFCYAFPSVYEGFGIPIIDAQLFSTPVVCSDIPVFREIGKNSVLYSKLSPESFRNTFEKLINNNELSLKLKNNGNKNIARFSKNVILEQFKNLL